MKEKNILKSGVEDESNLSTADIRAVAAAYLLELMEALKRRVVRKRHVNVLQHIMGYLKKKIASDNKAEIAGSIEAYRRGEVSLIVPVALLKHYLRVHPDPYMEQQGYLHPHPEKLGLRNVL